MTKHHKPAAMEALGGNVAKLPPLPVDPTGIVFIQFPGAAPNEFEAKSTAPAQTTGKPGVSDLLGF